MLLSGLIRYQRLGLLAMGVSLCLLLAAVLPADAGDPFSFTGSWNYRETGGDIESTSAFSHNYNLTYAKELSQFIGLSAALRYNENLPSEGANTSSISPTLSVDARNDLFFVNFSLTKNQLERDGAPTISSDTVGGTFFTIAKELPIVRLFYTLTDDYNDASPKSLDTSTTTFGGGIEYSLYAFDMLYNYRNSTAEDKARSITGQNVEHLAQLKYSDSFFAERLSLAASQQYQNNQTTTETTTDIGGDFFVPVPILDAFSGPDDTPATGTLPSNPDLIDGDRATPAGVDITSSTIRQNIAAQVNLQTVGRFRVYLDQELSTTLQGLLNWEVWESDDNFLWTQVSGVIPASYVLENGRTVVVIDLITPVNSRYVKAVSRMTLASLTPVSVTELEVGEIQTSTAERVKIRSRLVSHRTEFSATIHPSADWQASYNMRYNQSEQQNGISGSKLTNSVNVTYFATSRVTISAGATDSRDKTDDSAERLTRNYAVSVNAAVLPTLNLSLGYTRTEISGEERVNSTSDSINAVISAVLYPDLTARLNNSWRRTLREDGNEFTSMGFTLNTSARFTPRLDVNLVASYFTFENKDEFTELDTDGSATRYGISANYRPSDILLLNGNLNRNEDTDQNSLGGNATLLLTRELQFLVGTAFEFGEVESQRYNATMSWLLNRAMSLRTNGTYLATDAADSWSFASTLNASF